MQVNSIFIKRKCRRKLPFLWLFLDEDRIFNEATLLKSIPSSKSLGVIVRVKKKKHLYKKTKKVNKICKAKGFSIFVSSNPQIALSVGADGVHFPRQFKQVRKYAKLLYSCSFHGLSDLRKTKNLKVEKVFISPIFKTNSNKKKKPLGLTRLLFLSRSLRCEVGVLGGINSSNIKKFCGKGISHLGGVSAFISKKNLLKYLC